VEIDSDTPTRSKPAWAEVEVMACSGGSRALVKGLIRPAGSDESVSVSFKLPGARGRV